MNRSGFKSRGFAGRSSAARAEAAPAYPPRPPKILSRSHAAADRVLSALPSLWEAPGWLVVPQVRRRLGAGVDGQRIADALAVELGADGRVLLVEVKVGRGDWLEELAEPEKADEIGQHCAGIVVAVPGPWDRIVLAESELPEGWGLVEVEGSRARLVVAPAEREGVELPADLWRSVARSISTAAERAEVAEVGAPVRMITRPRLGAGIVGLACGHVAPAPLAKRAVSMPCFSCGEGWPVDLEVVRAVIEEATPETRRMLRAQLEQRGGGTR